MIEYKQKVSNWYFPRIQDIGSIDKHLINNKQKLLAKYHYIVDEFFACSPLQKHYEAYLNQLKPSCRKRFKSRCITIFLQIMKILQDNPQQYHYEPSIATCKAMIYWHIHFIRRYRGMFKYTNRLNDVSLPMISGNDKRFDINKRKLNLLVKKYHNRLMDLYFKIY